jgi:hypothetical protein
LQKLAFLQKWVYPKFVQVFFAVIIRKIRFSRFSPGGGFESGFLAKSELAEVFAVYRENRVFRPHRHTYVGISKNIEHYICSALHSTYAVPCLSIKLFCSFSARLDLAENHFSEVPCSC